MTEQESDELVLRMQKLQNVEPERFRQVLTRHIENAGIDCNLLLMEKLIEGFGTRIVRDSPHFIDSLNQFLRRVTQIQSIPTKSFRDILEFVCGIGDVNTRFILERLSSHARSRDSWIHKLHKDLSERLERYEKVVNLMQLSALHQPELNWLD